MPGLHRLQAAMRRWWMVAAAIAGAVILGWGSYAIGSLQAQADALSTALERQRGQAEASGQQPVAPPASEIRENPEIVVDGEPVLPTDEQLRPLVQQYVEEWLADNPPAAGRDAPTLAELTDVIVDRIAAELVRNPPPPGEDGQSPTPEELRPVIVQEVAAELERNPPPAGQDGDDGEDGQDGEDGADSTVPGPAGEPPLSWTFTTRDVLGQETTHRCVRDEPFDASAPTYTCRPVEPESGG